MKISVQENLFFSAVAYYRSIGTFSYLPKLNPNIEIDILNRVSWNTLINTDIYYSERPQTDNDLEALELVKDFNIKTWIDYDDLLHNVPEYNPCYNEFFEKHTGKKTKKLLNVEKAIEMADIVTVSTPAIKEYYSKINKNIHVIENAHNDYRYPFEKVENTFDSINWRGSATHKDDLLSVSSDMFNISETYDNWVFVLIGNGDYLWFIKDGLKKKFHIGECDTIVYNKFIKGSKSAIQIVPLLVNEFNIAKSNIGWIEGTYAGSCTIVPEMPEFDKPGAIIYKQEEGSFGYKLEKAIKSKSFRQKQYLESYEYIKENLMLSKVNQKRIEIMERLL